MRGRGVWRGYLCVFRGKVSVTGSTHGPIAGAAEVVVFLVCDSFLRAQGLSAKDGFLFVVPSIDVRSVALRARVPVCSGGSL